MRRRKEKKEEGKGERGEREKKKEEEVERGKEDKGRRKEKEGVYSVLGNHDYGDYVNWETNAEKEANLQQLFAIQAEMGFTLLRNETHFLEKDGQRLALVGVENWGKGGFKKKGDLEKAIANVAADDFKILLSHDPSHWEAKYCPIPIISI